MNSTAADSEYDIISSTALFYLKRKGLREEVIEVNRSPFLIGKFPAACFNSLSGNISQFYEDKLCTVSAGRGRDSDLRLNDMKISSRSRTWNFRSDKIRYLTYRMQALSAYIRSIRLQANHSCQGFINIWVSTNVREPR